MRRRWVWGVAALLLSVIALGGDLPAQHQAAMLFRILPYDRNLATRAGDEVVISVVYRDNDAGSTAAQRELVDALTRFAAKTKVAGLPAKVQPLAFTTAAKLTEELRRTSSSAVYLCPGLGDGLASILQVTRAEAVLTFTASEAYVRSGASVGVVRRGDKAAILVNLSSSRAEHADLDSAFLELAEVIR